MQTIRNNNGNSRYSNHILNTEHAYGSTRITDNDENYKIEKNGKHLNILQKYHIQYIKIEKQITLEWHIYWCL
jgi:uncharacterized membrane protein